VQLGRDQVHLWLARHPASLDAAERDACTALLDASERARLERFAFDRLKIEYLVTRTLVRRVLAACTGCAPTELRFGENGFGKPHLIGEGMPRFNLSHCAGATVLAVTRDREVGIDIEPAGRPGDLIGIAQRFFAPPEVEALLRLAEAERPDRFLALWTLKEAFIKAVGQGLSLPLEAFAFSFPQAQAIEFAWLGAADTVATDWQFRRFRPTPGHVAALAVEGARTPVTLACHRLIDLRAFASGPEWPLLARSPG
jgi:4'-phosphopantetheinyl transferase